MSALDLLKQQMFGAQQAPYEPVTKTGLAIKAMVDVLQNMAPSSPLTGVIVATSAMVIRKVDQEDPEKTAKLLEAIQAIAVAAADQNVTLEQFNTVIADWGGDLKALVA